MARKTYFYTDPVAALWMVQAFRFKILAGTFCLQPESVDAFLELLGRGTRHERYVVHQECVPLLTPKPGDVVEESGQRTKLKRLVAGNFPLTGGSYEILQRAGRPFFTPKSSE